MKNVNTIKHAIVSVDVAVFCFQNSELKVGLIKVVNEEYKGKYACPGALMKPEETAKEAVERVLDEKVGINSKKVYLEELGAYSEISRDVRGRVVSIAYVGLINDLKLLEGIGDRMEFVNVSKAKSLAYDHDKILKDAMQKLQDRFYTSTVAQKILKNEFTMKDFLDLYSLVLNKEIDKRNFSKKIKSLKIIKENGKLLREGKFRPAKYFEFVDHKVKNLEVF